MSNSRMRAPALAGVATVWGARGAPGPTPMRARGTKRGPTSVPAPHHILAEVSSDVGRAPPGGQLYSASPRAYDGLPDLAYPLHDRDVLVTACGRICMHRKRVNISTVLAGQRLGIKEVDDGIWIVSFMRYDLGFIDLEQKTLQPLDNPFGPDRKSVV